MKSILEGVRQNQRTILTEVESKQILALYSIPAVDTRVARSEDDAAQLARLIGFPAVLKVYSETITHKTDVGGVKLNLGDEPAVRRAYREIESSIAAKAGAANFQGVTVQPMLHLEGYELILGSSVDPQFGPVMLFGSGGQLVEVYRDRALALPPLNTTLAQRLIEQTRIYQALKGVRGRSAINLEELKLVLVRFSRLIVEQPWIKEIDINPLLASPGQIVALDARIIVHDMNMEAAKLPRLAIRPYPTQYIRHWSTKNGTPVVIRPIRPEDEPLMAKFHESISERSVYLRYFHMENLSARIAHERLIQKCFIDYDREMALVADFHNAQTSEHEILAVGRLTRIPGVPEAEVAVLVSDPWQGQRFGTELLNRLIDVGRAEHLDRLIANILPENGAMMALANHFDFHLVPSDDPGLLVAVLDL